MRRTWILIGLLFAAALGAQTDSAPNGGSGRHLRRLETNADPHPLAIEPGPPRFSWTIECPFGETAKGPVRQTAWRVRVYDDTASEKDAAPVWDSGLTRGDTGVDVPYSGPPLRGLARYRFTVDVQISVNGVDVAEPLTATDGRFETGPGAGEWRAAWIGAPLEHPIESAYLDVGASWYWTGEGDARVDAPAGERTFRTFYEVDAKSLSGTTECVITGDDEVAVWINNVRVLSHANHREYRRVDISDRLVAGRNVIVLKAKNAKGPAGLSGYIVTTPPAPDGMPVVSDFLAPAFWTAEAIDVLKVPESDPKIWKSVRRVAAAGESPWGRPRMIRSGLPATALRRSFSLRRRRSAPRGSMRRRSVRSTCA